MWRRPPRGPRNPRPHAGCPERRALGISFPAPDGRLLPPAPLPEGRRCPGRGVWEPQALPPATLLAGRAAAQLRGDVSPPSPASGGPEPAFRRRVVRPRGAAGCPVAPGPGRGLRPATGGQGPGRADPVGMCGPAGPGARARGVSPRAGPTWVCRAWGCAEARTRRARGRRPPLGPPAGCVLASAREVSLHPSSGFLVKSLKPKAPGLSHAARLLLRNSE